MRFAVTASLFMLALACLAGVDGAKVTHFLQLSVEGEEAGAVKTMADLEVMVKHAKEQKMGENILIWLRSAMQKVGKGVEEAKRTRSLNQKKNQAKAAKAVELAQLRAKEAPFTSGDVTVRALKMSMHAKKCNIKRYASPAALNAALKADAVDLESPFLVSGAATKDNAAVKTFRKGWTAEALKAMKDVGIRFLAPRLAKVVTQGEDGQPQAGAGGGQTMEVFQPQVVTFDTYFATCFGKKKSPGTDTEHCEQVIPALALAELGVKGGMEAEQGNGTALLDSLMADMYSGRDTEGQLGQFSVLRRFETHLDESTSSLLEAASQGSPTRPDMEDLFGPQLEAFIGSLGTRKHTVRTVMLGPSASGKTFKSTKHTPANPQMGESPKSFASSASYVDLLVFGQRRWVFLSDERFQKIHRQAGAELAGMTTAYQFFEGQYEDFKEEYGVAFKKDGAEGGAWECNQNTGDALYVPSTLHSTSLALDDGLSYRESVATWGKADGGGASLHTSLSKQVFNAEASEWGAALCYLDRPPQELADALEGVVDWAKLPLGVQGSATPAVAAKALVDALAHSAAAQPENVNIKVGEVLALCHAVLHLHPVVPADATVCGRIWDRCAATLKENAGGEKEVPLSFARAGLATRLLQATPVAASAAPPVSAAPGGAPATATATETKSPTKKNNPKKTTKKKKKTKKKQKKEL